MTIGHLFADVSWWQGTIDWEEYAMRIDTWNVENDAPNYVAVVIRAGSCNAETGVCYSDYNFVSNVVGAQWVCDEIDFYWYFRPDKDLKAQAKYYYDLIRQQVPGNWVWKFDNHGAYFQVDGKGIKYRIWVDCEETGGLSPKALDDAIWNMMTAIFDLAGNATGAYTRQSWWDPNVSGDHTWKLTCLWAARHYETLTGPWSDGKYVFRDWDKWVYWQFSSKGNGRAQEFGAASGDIDLNYSNGFFEAAADGGDQGEGSVSGEYANILESIASDTRSIDIGIGAMVDLFQEWMEKQDDTSGGGTEPEVTYIMVQVREDPRVNARCVKGVNVSGYPIMQIYPKDTSAASERVQWEKGAFIMVQPDIVRADGGDRYYRVIPSEYADGLPQLYVPQASVSKIE